MFSDRVRQRQAQGGRRPALQGDAAQGRVIVCEVAALCSSMVCGQSGIRHHKGVASAAAADRDWLMYMLGRSWRMRSRP